MDGNRQGGILDLLCSYVDSVVTIYTESHCFTGLLTNVRCGLAKMVTRNNCGCSGGCNYGKITVIPICEITAVTLCNTGV